MTTEHIIGRTGQKKRETATFKRPIFHSTEVVVFLEHLGQVISTGFEAPKNPKGDFGPVEVEEAV